MLVLANRSIRPQAADHRTRATWIDHRLVERDPTPLSMGGFGRSARRHEAVPTIRDERLARRQGQRVIMRAILEHLAST
jgi:hypothetical protein